MGRYCYSKEVQEAYERLQHPLAIFQFIDGQVLLLVVSDGFCEMFGYENQEQAYAQVNQDVAYHVHPEDVTTLRNEISRFTSEGGDYEAVYRYRVGEADDYKVIRAVGKHVPMEEDVNLAHIWYTDVSVNVNQKIIELQESVTALLTNMPAMTFSKDVETRKYLACNQAFADYAHKETVEGVVGLTDFEIFDDKTAWHFIEDDKKALAMDKPYIFFEDVPDAAGNPRQFQTTKLKFVDATGRTCLLGLCQDVTDAMRIKKEYDERLAYISDQANIDPLTGIRNKNSYVNLENKINKKIKDNSQGNFAVTLFDVNDLKKINDNLGHMAGDDYICGACRIICRTYKHSPVFRIGGDEFVAISEGEDYENIEKLLDELANHNERAKREGGIVIAVGMARYCDEDDVASVFKQADMKMYENKRFLKGLD